MKACRCLFVLVCLMVTIATSGAFAAQEVVPDYPEWGSTAQDVTAFARHLAAERDALKEQLQEQYPDKPQKVTGNAALVAFERLAQDSRALAAAVPGGALNDAQMRTFTRLQRVHYSLLADLGKGSKLPRYLRGWSMAKNMGFGPLLLNVPYCFGPNDPIGRRLAAKEAIRLYGPGGKGPLPTDVLARMTPVEISRLQPAADHPAIIADGPGHHYQRFLDEQVELIRLQGGDLEKFDPSYAQRILYYDELKEDATSPKVTGKDRFGLKWKLKWGDEVHTDVALTRIYIDLGGTYTDLKFYSGPGETLLILAAPGDTGKDAVHTWHELSAQLLQSKFEFHADRYLLPGSLLKDKQGRILGSGQVDAAMAERESLKKKFIGAYYVTFKECQLSLYSPAIKRLGASPLCRLGALTDRVARSSIVFNCWIKNKDMKDDNSRVGYLFNPESGEFDRLVEFQSDLGCTMGSLRSSGELNSFERSFVDYQQTTINFRMKPLYIPQAWKECTWADARWMALRIARLTRADIERSCADAGWPAFAQKVAVERLINRRNELVKAFKLELDGIAPLPCDPKFTLTVEGKHGDDKVVKRGDINGSSPTVQALENSAHPEGLAEVISRKND